MKMTDISHVVGDLTISIPEWTLQPGKIHGLMGPNGCGKTTVAKLLLDLIPLSHGTINRDGLSIKDMTIAAQRPYLMQDTVYANICYPLKLRKMPINQSEIDEYLIRFDLMNKKKEYARSLSSGERQKLSLIRALIFHPQFIVIDEACSNLDMESVMKIESWIHEIQDNRKITWVIISHQIAQLYRLCDEIHYMEHGKIVESGLTEELFTNPKQVGLKHFLKFQTGKE